jgi:hypothetical protein
MMILKFLAGQGLLCAWAVLFCLGGCSKDGLHRSFVVVEHPSSEQSLNFKVTVRSSLPQEQLDSIVSDRAAEMRLILHAHSAEVMSREADLRSLRRELIQVLSGAELIQLRLEAVPARRREVGPGVREKIKNLPGSLGYQQP